MLYFAYGSNMSGRRLKARLASAEPLQRARLTGYRLCFHKYSADGSGKCDIVPADDSVHGVVYRIADAEKTLLDAYEDYGRGYTDCQVEVVNEDGALLTAITYQALLTDPQLQPFHWYKAHVLIGAREHGLPADYIRSLEAVVSRPDPDRQRHAAETAIYDATELAAVLNLQP